jgi:hypothetical protein
MKDSCAERPLVGELPVLRLGDRVELRKAHPCGSIEWVIYRLGADIGLRCAGCNKRMLMPRSAVNKSLKRILSAGGEEGTTP